MKTGSQKYPRWAKHGRIEYFYPYKNRRFYEVHQEAEGRFVAAGHDFKERFPTTQDAQDFLRVIVRH